MLPFILTSACIVFWWYFAINHSACLASVIEIILIPHRDLCRPDLMTWTGNYSQLTPGEFQFVSDSVWNIGLMFTDVCCTFPIEADHDKIKVWIIYWNNCNQLGTHTPTTVCLQRCHLMSRQRAGSSHTCAHLSQPPMSWGLWIPGIQWMIFTLPSFDHHSFGRPSNYLIVQPPPLLDCHQTLLVLTCLCNHVV